MRYDELPWEDETPGPTPTRSPGLPLDEDFATLLKADLRQEEAPRQYEVGELVRAKVIQLANSEGEVLVDLGRYFTGIFEAEDEELSAGLEIGDEVRAYVTNVSDAEVRLSLSLGRKNNPTIGQLKAAFEKQIPIKGRVEGENRGGFDVNILGHKAFCPISQMDTRFIEDKTPYLQQEYEFIIEKWDESARQIVISRTVLLRKKAETLIDSIASALENGEVQEFDGMVTEVREYGAFVDIGGLDGFVHISELSHLRVKSTFDFLVKGQKVKVRVIRVENIEGKRRVVLSMKAAREDPWSRLDAEALRGEILRAKVTRIEEYGAFVNLSIGVEGLVHVSEFSWDRKLVHPSDFVEVNDEIKVKVVDLSPEQKRISLSIRALEGDPWENLSEDLVPGQIWDGKVESLKGFGAIVNLAPGISALLPLQTMKRKWSEDYRPPCSPGKVLKVTIQQVDAEQHKIILGLPSLPDEPDDGEDYKDYLSTLSKISHSKAAKSYGGLGTVLAAEIDRQTKTKK